MNKQITHAVHVDKFLSLLGQKKIEIFRPLSNIQWHLTSYCCTSFQQYMEIWYMTLGKRFHSPSKAARTSSNLFNSTIFTISSFTPPTTNTAPESGEKRHTCNSPRLTFCAVISSKLLLLSCKRQIFSNWNYKIFFLKQRTQKENTFTFWQKLGYIFDLIILLNEISRPISSRKNRNLCELRTLSLGNSTTAYLTFHQIEKI